MQSQNEKVIVVSGGFDPLHYGHVRYFKEARKLGDKLIVILNTDNFLRLKKGYVFMRFNERKEIIESIKYVDKIVKCIDKDNTVCETLKMLKKKYPNLTFSKGGDKNISNIPEAQTCDNCGIRMVFDVGGGKIQSSSWLINKILNQNGGK
jgi:D-beta-D-heptose 7-phosphate kinase/D-beta-D-heptose 1-phosphate adenosyltransferase